jgi:hypothetical protein
MTIQYGPVDLDDTLPGTIMSEGETSSVRGTKPHLNKLELLNLDEWNEYKTYDEDPPSYIHYLIKWKVMLNNKAIYKDTEQNLVLVPRFY